MKKRWIVTAIIMLSLVIATITYAPSVIQQKVTTIAAQFDANLQCLDWSMQGASHVKIDNLCLEYKGITFLVRDADLTLSLPQLWHSPGSLALLTRARIQRFDIQLPMSKLKYNERSKTRSNTPSEFDLEQVADLLTRLPFVPLPDIAISQLTLRLISAKNNQAAKQGDNFLLQEPLANTPLLSWHLEAKAESAVNGIKFTSLLDKQQWFKATQSKDGKVQFVWQLKLANLHDTVIPFLDVRQRDKLQSLTAVSGLWQGELGLHSNSTEPWQSSHILDRITLQLAVPEVSKDPMTLRGDLAFDLASNGKAWQISNISQQPLTLNGFSALVHTQLETVNLQQWQLQEPLAEVISIQLPTALHLTDNSNLTGQGPLWLKSGKQAIRLDEIVASFSATQFSAKLSASSVLQFKQDTLNLDGSVSVTVALSADLLYQPKLHMLQDIRWQLSSDEVFKLLPENLNARIKSSTLQGQSTAQITNETWQIDGDFAARINQPEWTLTPELQFKTENISITGTYSLQPQDMQLQSSVSLNQQVSIALGVSGVNDNLEVTSELSDASIKSIMSLLQGVPKQLKVTQGVMTASATMNVEQGLPSPVQLSADIAGVSGAWESYLFSELQTELTATVNSDGTVITENNRLQLASIFAGVDIRDISLEYDVVLNAEPSSDISLKLQNVSANLLGGEISISQPFYPMAKQGRLNLQVERLSVSELVTLFDQQGLTVTGALSGTVPVSFSEGSVSVQHASLNSVQGGIIRISDNPAFISLKNSQKNLAETLGLLEHIQYSKLDTSLSMQPDGWLELAVKMQGINPEKQQPINFNPTFSTNLYTGLKALRAGKDISQAIENRF